VDDSAEGGEGNAVADPVAERGLYGGHDGVEAGACSGGGAACSLEAAVEEAVAWKLVRSVIDHTEGGDCTRPTQVDHVRGRGCSFSVGQSSISVDIDWLLRTVPENGSCFIAAIARAFARVDFNVLKRHPSLEGFAWTAVECWADFGKQLLEGNDLRCNGLRERISRLLWNNAAAIHAGGYMPVDLGIGRDITRTVYNRAVKRARTLGMLDPGDDSVKQWAVALLEPTTHFTEEAIRAVLAMDFSDMVAVLVV
jgi:hypothetical protein